MSKNYGFEYALYKSLGSTTYASGTGISNQVKSSSGQFYGFMCTTADNTPLLTIYDNTVASGTAIFGQFTPVAGTLYKFDAPVQFNTGLYIYSTGSVIGTITYV